MKRPVSIGPRGPRAPPGRSRLGAAVDRRGPAPVLRTLLMKIKARDGKTYDVDTAPPGGSHEVRLDGVVVGSFVLEPEETVVTVKSKSVTEARARRHRQSLRRQGRRADGDRVSAAVQLHPHPLPAAPLPPVAPSCTARTCASP